VRSRHVVQMKSQWRVIVGCPAVAPATRMQTASNARAAASHLTRGALVLLPGAGHVGSLLQAPSDVADLVTSIWRDPAAQVAHPRGAPARQQPGDDHQVMRARDRAECHPFGAALALLHAIDRPRRRPLTLRARGAAGGSACPAVVVPVVKGHGQVTVRLAEGEAGAGQRRVGVARRRRPLHGDDLVAVQAGSEQVVCLRPGQ
jgi:hypothetical protein